PRPPPSTLFPYTTLFRSAQLERRLGRPAGRLLVGRQVAAREDDSLRAEAAHEVIGNVMGMDLAVDLRLAHPASDQLRVLRAEIQDRKSTRLNSSHLGISY